MDRVGQLAAQPGRIEKCWDVSAADGTGIGGAALQRPAEADGMRRACFGWLTASADLPAHRNRLPLPGDQTPLPSRADVPGVRLCICSVISAAHGSELDVAIDGRAADVIHHDESRRVPI
jgi:hypothetical protein